MLRVTYNAKKSYIPLKQMEVGRPFHFVGEVGLYVLQPYRMVVWMFVESGFEVLDVDGEMLEKQVVPVTFDHIEVTQEY